MGYKYHLQLDKAGNTESETESMEFDFENHDDIFRIVQMLEQSGRFGDSVEVRRFAVGLKLLGGVMMDNRDNELFKDFEPAFGAFVNGESVPRRETLLLCDGREKNPPPPKGEQGVGTDPAVPAVLAGAAPGDLGHRG